MDTTLQDLNGESAYEQFEKRLKDTYSTGQIEKVKELLKEEPRNRTGVVGFIPIVHNNGKVYLQMWGWSINLYDDGTWCWEDTTGG